MTVSTLSAAKRMCEKSGWSLSNLKLQKLLYIAHMFYMAENNGEPLISGRFEAWDYGPVVPGLYHFAKVFGSEPIENIFHGIPDLGDGPEAETLDEAVEKLGHASPGRLVAITHWDKGAWASYYQSGLRGAEIPNPAIIEEYNERCRATAAAKA